MPHQRQRSLLLILELQSLILLLLYKVEVAPVLGVHELLIKICDILNWAASK